MNTSDAIAETQTIDQIKHSNDAGIDSISDAAPTSGGNPTVIPHDACKTPSEEDTADHFAFAKEVLRNVPEMSEERTTLLQDRIKNGYYSEPKVIQTIAERISTEVEGIRPVEPDDEHRSKIGFVVVSRERPTIHHARSGADSSPAPLMRCGLQSGTS